MPHLGSICFHQQREPTTNQLFSSSTTGLHTPTETVTWSMVLTITTRTSNNTMAARTVAAIGVRQVANGTGSCTFFSLATHTFFTANHFVLLPMTQAVINHLNALAASNRSKVSATTPFYIGDRLLPDTLPESGDPSGTSATGDTPPSPAEPESDSGHT